MSESMYPSTTRELAQKRRELSVETEAAFQAFGQKVFEDGALSAKVNQIIAVAVAHVTQCPYCIKGHTKAALRHGATMKRLWRRFGSRPKCVRGRVCTFDSCDRRNGESCKDKKPMNGLNYFDLSNKKSDHARHCDRRSRSP